MNALPDAVRVLVTRPAHQAENLSRLLVEQGAEAIRLPSLVITALENTDAIRAKLATVDKFQWLVFISANAVNFAVQANDGKINPRSAAVAAIGLATATVLQQAQIRVDLTPLPPYNSEALLAMPAMQQVKGQHILLVRGEGGRDELANTLQQRGALTEYLDVYKRCLPTQDCSSVQALLAAGQLHVVTATSGEALQNLLMMIDEQYHQQLLAVPLVVISDSLKQIASEKGFKRIAVAKAPADAAIVDEVKTIIGEIG